MAEGLNRVILLGNLGAAPDLRYTQAGQPVLNLRLATTVTHVDTQSGERKERTDWHTVVVWGKRGEGLAKVLTKGSSLLVEGSLRSSSYEDANGNKRHKVEVYATNVVLTGGARGERRQGSEVTPIDAARTVVHDSYGRSQDRHDGGAGGGDDDVPF